MWPDADICIPSVKRLCKLCHEFLNNTEDKVSTVDVRARVFLIRGFAAFCMTHLATKEDPNFWYQIGKSCIDVFKQICEVVPEEALQDLMSEYLLIEALLYTDVKVSNESETAMGDTATFQSDALWMEKKNISVANSKPTFIVGHCVRMEGGSVNICDDSFSAVEKTSKTVYKLCFCSCLV